MLMVSLSPFTFIVYHYYDNMLLIQYLSVCLSIQMWYGAETMVYVIRLFHHLIEPSL